MSKINKMINMCLIYIFITFIYGCTSTLSTVSKEAQKIKIPVRFPEQTVKAVVIIVHGLNLKPPRMDGWTDLFVDHGAIALRLSLFGHDGNIDSMKQIDSQIWRQQFDDGVREARFLADKYHVPLLFLGYSLGGLIGVDWECRQKQNARTFDKMVLLAPAIAMPWYTEIAKKVFSVLTPDLILPTPSPKEIRANSGSSVAAYQALFAIKDAVEAAHYKNANTETLVITDPHDELIPFNDIKNIISKYQLSQWKLEEINNSFAKENFGYRHLIADKETIGSSLWEVISCKVLKHFNL